MTTKHTPGPWSTDPESPRDVIGSDGFMVAECHTHERHPRARDAMTANAHLIAAAPDLLAACEMMLTVYGLSQEAPHAVEVMRAAIAKAKGKKP